MRRLALRLALYTAAGLTIVFALIAAGGWLLLALWLALYCVMSPAAAALCTGLAAILVALLIAVVLAFARRGRRSPTGGFDGEAVARLAAVGGREAGSFVAAHPGRATIAALAVGFVVGASPKLRAALREVLK